jgi:16S rRNA (cytosine1402-N4)-methyltransferase
MEHIPVLLHECLGALAIKPDGVYLDGTLGRAGHSARIAERLGKGGRLIAVDKDAMAIENAGRILAPYSDRVTLVQDDFRNVGPILDRLGIDKIDGMLFDLGVSSPQLDDAARGFSYMADAPLDMRMDTGNNLTAYDVVNAWPESELRRILYEYGEERYAARIAERICREREKAPIETTFRLVEVVRAAMPAKALREKQHPAKRTFQAVRIAVNDELGAIREMLHTAPDRLNPGGRLCVISFHSLEDRLVKEAFLARSRGCTCPPDFPVCTCGFKQTLRIVTKKPIVPTEEEILQNPRARSAKLRVAERV